MPYITLISDWQQGDYYLAAVKGKLYSLVPDLTLIDISHNIPTFNSRMTAFVLRHSYRAYPPGSVHMICVNTLESDNYPYVAIFHKEHFFVGVDNGIFSLIFEDKIEKAVYLDYSAMTTFPEYDILAEAAAFLANGGDINELGEPYTAIVRMQRFLPSFHENTITGMVIYVDSYGNLVSNISKDYFYQKANNQPFEILLDWGHYRIRSLSQRYERDKFGELIALFNSVGLLEIAMVGGSASYILNIHEEAEISVRFIKDEQNDERKNLLLK
ncbi:MAG: SAM hydrolase/SAM-dependent halogenase family protein [Bacteroidales bacterium]